MSEQDRVSPYNIITVSTRQVMRMKKNINLGIISWSDIKFFDLTLWEFYGWHLGEWQIWSGSQRVKSIKEPYSRQKEIQLNFLLKLLDLKSDFTLTLGYLNPALNNLALVNFLSDRKTSSAFAMSLKKSDLK